MTNNNHLLCHYCFEVKKKYIKLTHPIFERWHDLHAFSWDPELVGVNVVGGSALLSLLPICLHRCTAIFPVHSHTNHSRKVSLQNHKTTLISAVNVYIFILTRIYVFISMFTPWDNPLLHIQLSLNMNPCQRQELQLHLRKDKKKPDGYSINTLWHPYNKLEIVYGSSL